MINHNQQGCAYTVAVVVPTPTDKGTSTAMGSYTKRSTAPGPARSGNQFLVVAIWWWWWVVTTNLP